MGLRRNAPNEVLRGRHRDGDPLVLALGALGGFLFASAITLTGWDWSNVVMGAGSVLAFALAGRLRRGREGDQGGRRPMTLLTLAASAWKWTATVVTMPVWLPVVVALRRAEARS